LTDNQDCCTVADVYEPTSYEDLDRAKLYERDSKLYFSFFLLYLSAFLIFAARDRQTAATVTAVISVLTLKAWAWARCKAADLRGAR
jgi:hypothetical protein